MKAFIMAGGKGTRLSAITKNVVPKPMVEVLGVPLLERIILQLKKYEVDEFFISVSHLSEVIKNYFKNGEDYGVKIHYIEEKQPLGSAGALFYVKNEIKDDFIVCSGDLLFDVNIFKMLEFHKTKNAIATLFAHSNIHPYDSDLVVADENCKVIKFDYKAKKRNYYYDNLVNGGLFILNNKALDYFDCPKKANFEKDFLASLIGENKNVYAYFSPEYLKDVGTPERLYGAEKDLKNNLPEKKNLINLQKCVFLDRDGTINKYIGFVSKTEDLIVLKNAIKAIRLLNKSQYLAIVVTNQPVVARGECSISILEEIHNKLKTILGENGAFVDAIYYCPHHPDKGFDGEVSSLKFDCSCRKPKTGLIEKAKKDFNLDLSKCYIVGDTDADVDTGRNANLKTILVKSNAKCKKKVKPDKRARNLLSAVKKILKNKV
ncbi:MAG: HAD-IIIA family hydrolase [Clostridia bacterium]